MKQIVSVKSSTKKVCVCGFVNNIRILKNIIFITLRDSTGIIQCVSEDTSQREALKKITLESYVEICGLVKKEKQAISGIEIKIEKINIISLAQTLPIPVTSISSKKTKLKKRFDYRWLDLRSNEKQLIFKVWTKLEQGFRDYLLANDFTQIYTPSLMSSASESGSEVFEVKYFNKKAYLAQSPQFYKQMAIASGLEKVFMVGPVFRAEPSFTIRHMTEFTGWDIEVANIKDHTDIMQIEEQLIVNGFLRVKEVFSDIEIPTVPFVRLTMVEAKKILVGLNVYSEKEYDLSPLEEKEICKYVKQKYNHDFVFITDYSVNVRPFYHMRSECGTTKSFDLLYKGIEITTGAQREHRYSMLISQATEKHINIDSIKKYLEFFSYGCPAHGGMGIGPARIVMQILNLGSVKEATFLPRDVKRLVP